MSVLAHPLNWSMTYESISHFDISIQNIGAVKQNKKGYAGLFDTQCHVI